MWKFIAITFDKCEESRLYLHLQYEGASETAFPIVWST